MRKVIKILLFFSLFSFGNIAVFSCTCVSDSLSKRFKKAKVIFVGELTDYEKSDIPNIQNYRESLPVLYVVRAWKGIKKEYIAVDFDSEFSANCPTFDMFEKDKQYLVFAYGKELKVTRICSDTRAIRDEYDWTIREISKLNSSWFRFWAKANPF